MTIIKAQGVLEKRLAQRGVKINWSEFSSGLPLLEALNVGGVDLSADVADTVPVFAQAAGAKLTSVAQEAPSPSAQAIIVRADSPIKSVADLKRKKIAVTKAAGVHYLLIATLEKAGLKFSDIDVAYLTPADGRAAFERGSVDAWVTWDPFLAGVQKQTQVRILSDGRNIADYQRYYLASTPFADAHPDVLATVFSELKKTGLWVRQNPKEAAAFLAPLWGLDAPTMTPTVSNQFWTTSGTQYLGLDNPDTAFEQGDSLTFNFNSGNSRRSSDVRTVVVNALSEQQRIADTFFAAGLLPKKVNATDVAIWKPA